LNDILLSLVISAHR